MIKVGDWVTQYYKGYWMVIGIVPKYPNRYALSNEEAINTPEENWIIMKKGFTPKMGFKLDNACP